MGQTYMPHGFSSVRWPTELGFIGILIRLGLLLLLSFRLRWRRWRWLVNYVGPTVAISLFGQTQIGQRQPFVFCFLERIALGASVSGHIACFYSVQIGRCHLSLCLFTLNAFMR